MTSITTSLRVWQKQGYEANRRTDDWIIGIVVGAVGAMICANLLYAARLRDSLYLLYAAVLVESGMLAIFHLGYASELLYLLAPQQIHRIWGVVVCLYSIVMVLFLGRLFEFHRHWIWGWYIVQGVALLNGIALIFSIAGYYGDVGFFVSRLQQLSHIFISFVVIYLLFFKKQKQYIMPAIAFASVIGIILLMQAQYTGANILLIDSSLSRLFVAGTLIHLALLSAAVAKRAQLAERGLSEEKDRVIAMSRSAEQNLAFKVQEKTAELAEKNASLNAEIDRRHLLEMKLMQSLNSVNDALAQQGEFIALVSHEFRGPLGVIAASAHNLSFSIDKNASATTLRIAKIRQAVKKMSMLIENVLASDQITAGSTSLAKTEMLDLNEILLIAKTGLDDDAAKRVEFIPGEEAVLEGDRNLLEILLQNLIQNALKYSTNNSPVTVQLSVDEDAAFVDVIDRGIGVAPDDRERIFQKYYRAAGQRVNGSGLGLYISREIARQHGGNLVLTASDPRGSAFRLSLPLKRRDLDNPVPGDSALSDQSKRQT